MKKVISLLKNLTHLTKTPPKKKKQLSSSTTELDNTEKMDLIADDTVSIFASDSENGDMLNDGEANST